MNDGGYQASQSGGEGEGWISDEEISEATVESHHERESWMSQFTDKNGRYLKVTLKVLRTKNEPLSQLILLSGILKEVQVWRNLKHPNVLEFLGVSHRGPYKVSLVTPWMERGNVYDYLKENNGVPRYPLVLQTAEAVRYLHSATPPIVHGDIKATNILIGPYGEVRLADFGLARVRLQLEGSDVETAIMTPRNARWMAPESLAYDDYGFESTAASLTRASDVYSFGMTAYEIYTGCIPFYDTRNHFRIPEQVENGQRPSRPDKDEVEASLFPDTWSLLEACWAADRFKRPTADEVVERLTSDEGWDRSISKEDASASRVEQPEEEPHETPTWSVYAAGQGIWTMLVSQWYTILQSRFPWGA